MPVAAAALLLLPPTQQAGSLAKTLQNLFREALDGPRAQQANIHGITGWVKHHDDQLPAKNLTLRCALSPSHSISGPLAHKQQHVLQVSEQWHRETRHLCWSLRVCTEASRFILVLRQLSGAPLERPCPVPGYSLQYSLESVLGLTSTVDERFQVHTRSSRLLGELRMCPAYACRPQGSHRAHNVAAGMSDCCCRCALPLPHAASCPCATQPHAPRDCSSGRQPQVMPAISRAGGEPAANSSTQFGHIA